MADLTGEGDQKSDQLNRKRKGPVLCMLPVLRTKMMLSCESLINHWKRVKKNEGFSALRLAGGVKKDLIFPPGWSIIVESDWAGAPDRGHDKMDPRGFPAGGPDLYIKKAHIPLRVPERGRQIGRYIG